MLDILRIVGVFDQIHEAKANYIGNAGESAFNQAAQQHLSNDYYVISNVVLKVNNGTTQIDQIIVSKFGLFIVEIKNYKGWIWGDVSSSQWTQTLPRGKYKFQNPLRQNHKHIKALQALLGCQDHFFKSLIAFSIHAKFKTELPVNVISGGIAYLNFINSYKTVLMSDEDVALTIKKILDNRLSNDEHQAHISKIKEQYDNADKNNAPQCPRCEKQMVLRKAKSGKNIGNSFWGCSSYPQCKGIVNIKSDEDKIHEELRKINGLFKRLF